MKDQPNTFIFQERITMHTAITKNRSLFIIKKILVYSIHSNVFSFIHFIHTKLFCFPSLLFMIFFFSTFIQSFIYLFIQIVRQNKSTSIKCIIFFSNIYMYTSQHRNNIFIYISYMHY